LGVSAINLAPQIKSQVDQISQAEKITKSYDLADFNSIRVGGQNKVIVTKAPEWSVKISGAEDTLERVKYSIEDGELKIWDESRPKGICIFCFLKTKTIEITMPELKSFIAYGNAEAEVGDFEEDIRINAGESASVKAEVSGSELLSYIAGTSGRLELIGSPEIINATLEGGGRLIASKLDAKSVEVYPSVFSRVTLGGQASELTAELEGTARLYAFGLEAKTVSVKTADYSRAEVNAALSLNAIAQDTGRVTYKGEPESITKKTSQNGTVKRSDEYELDEIKNGSGDIILRIKTDVDSYAPWMSSVRGIGLEPVVGQDAPAGIRFIWQTNDGTLVEDWASTVYETRVENAGQKIYWTYNLGKPREAGDVSDILVTLKAQNPGDSEIIGETEIRMEFGEDGVVRVVD